MSLWVGNVIMQSRNSRTVYLEFRTPNTMWPTYLSSVDELISQTLRDRLDVTECCLTCTSTQQPDSLKHKVDNIKLLHFLIIIIKCNINLRDRQVYFSFINLFLCLCTKTTHSHSNLALYSQIYLFFQIIKFFEMLKKRCSVNIDIRGYPKFRLFRSISNRFWGKCKFMCFYFF